MPITGDCTSGRKRFLWVVSLKGKQQVSLRFLKKGVAASVSLLRRGGVLYQDLDFFEGPSPDCGGLSRQTAASPPPP